MSTLSAAPAEPGDALGTCLLALRRGDLPTLRAMLCIDACFLTADRTPIRGRDRIGALFAQLIAASLRVRLDADATLELSDFALLQARLHMHLPGGPRPYDQVSRGDFALTRREGRWKLLLLAPWGWP